MNPKTRIVLIGIVIFAPVIVILLAAIILYVNFGENHFLEVCGPIGFWFLGILVGYLITKQRKRAKTNAPKGP